MHHATPRLHYHRGNANLAPHMVLVDGDLVLYEAASICLYLADKHPDARPARSLPHLGPYLQRMLARPAVQRAFAAEQLKPPLA